MAIAIATATATATHPLIDPHGHRVVGDKGVNGVQLGLEERLSERDAGAAAPRHPAPARRRPGARLLLGKVAALAGPAVPDRGRRRRGLETKNGRKNVKSARYWPTLSEIRRRQRPAHVYARADPAQTGQNGEN